MKIKKNKRAFDLELLLPLVVDGFPVDPSRYDELKDMIEYLTEGKIFEPGYDTDVLAFLIYTHILKKFPKLGEFYQPNDDYIDRQKALYGDVLTLTPVPVARLMKTSTELAELIFPQIIEDADISLSAEKAPTGSIKKMSFHE